jgi:NhaP-type Na+/H+ or K+/H+ antiporter/mannitol/fructose-specific phosphotransferase system IIA component (Ntr-type)
MGHELIVQFGGALFLGILLGLIANKIKVSSIVLLLLGGILAGPWALGIIKPTILGGGLKAIIQLAVALILFEGGLSLDVRGYKELSKDIRNSLTIGVLITWAMCSIIVKIFFAYSWSISILAGSLIIVTGPTVIVPLLKRVGVNKRIHNFLHWEGVLIDPIGVFIALLCYEWIIGASAISLFGLRLLIGVGFGLAGGFILSRIIKWRIVPDEMLNVFMLSSAIGIFIVSDLIVSESGLMSVMIAGLFVGFTDKPQVEEIKIYKAQLIELLIGLLFVLLSANLDLGAFRKYFGWEMILAVLAVMFIVRPVNIFASTVRTGTFSLKEKVFLSWIAPRGIVAASMASLFALNLRASGKFDGSTAPEFIEAFTYTVICGTVIFQGFTAGWVGKLLKVLQATPTGWLIVGSHWLGRSLAHFMEKRGAEVILIDTNVREIKAANREGLKALGQNALTVNPDDFPELYGIGHVVAITSNTNLNILICERWFKKLQKPHIYRWAREVVEDGKDKPDSDGRLIWQGIPLNNIISHEITDKSPLLEHQHVDKIKHPDRVVCIFQKNKLSLLYNDNIIDEADILMYHPLDLKIDLNIKPQWVLFSESRSLSAILHEMIHSIKGDYPLIDHHSIHRNIMAMEREYSSVIGHKVALPHAYLDGIDESIVVAARFKDAVKIGDNNEEVMLVFLVLSPRNSPDTHISTLAKISKFIINEENQQALMDAGNIAEMIQVFFPEGN